jgi:predicted RNA binding protein YcfA (HicA-like mRNA interferase family)
MRGINKDYNDVVTLAQEQGWDVRIGKGGHLRFQSPQGELVFTSQTPSDRRSLMNAKACLRRAGLDLPHPQNRKKKS